MKQAYRLFSCLWWLAQGIVWFDIQFMTKSLCISAGVILILCGVSSFNSNKTISVLSLIIMMLYSIGFIVLAFMLIAVGSPKIWFAMILSIIALLNVALCIVDGYKLLKNE